MFAFSKVAWFLADPSNLFAFLALAALALLIVRKARRTAVACLAIAALGTVALGLGPVPSLLMQTLEDQYPPWQEDGRAVHGIIVLGGSIEPDIAAARDQLSVNETAERVIAMAALARRHPRAKVVFSGGSADLLGPGITEADALEKHQAELGLLPGRVLYERAARNTIENAQLAKALAQPKPGERWLLVTSAWHMPRSMEIFRRAGFAVTAAPVDYRSRGGGGLIMATSIARGLGRSAQALREWAGILALRLGAGI